jgi:hypothetical protein
MQRIIGAVFGLLVVGTLAFAQPSGAPPPEAVAACAQASEGAACGFIAPHGRVEGLCRRTPQGSACVPAGGPGRRPPTGGDEQDRSPRSPPPWVDIAARDASAQPVASRIPDTGQGSCFSDNDLIPCPRPGQRWYGQDAQYEGARPSYRDHGDGTVSDEVTGLMWQQAHNVRRLSWPAARAACDGLRLGGHDDWRLPSIKELFSIADFRGAAGDRPYLPDAFEIREPDAGVLENDPFRASHRTDMMGQTWSATIYSGDHWDRPGVKAAFFVNFLDGRIKSAPIAERAQGLFYRCVRGAAWGGNDFVDHGDGTASDRESGLMWQQADDGRSRDWEGALAYCESLDLAGHDDWRLPNVKELQHIVDYRRHDPALDERFLRQSNRHAWFWSSTTLGDNVRQATYVCFGRCTSIDGIDVHGAGAQRSDPKSGNTPHPGSQGGQQDEIRGHNYARCVRSGG